jgi:hypothetical protein
MAKREPPSHPQKPRAVVVGTIDMRTVLLESTYQRAVGADRSEARMALRVISSSTTRGRPEASVFLMGFLVSLPPDDWEMRIEAVEALKYTRTERCAALLFSELRRVKGSNTTRSYLSAIMDVLDKLPTSSFATASRSSPRTSPSPRRRGRSTAAWPGSTSR